MSPQLHSSSATARPSASILVDPHHFKRQFGRRARCSCWVIPLRPKNHRVTTSHFFLTLLQEDMGISVFIPSSCGTLAECPLPAPRALTHSEIVARFDSGPVTVNPHADSDAGGTEADARGCSGPGCQGGIGQCEQRKPRPSPSFSLKFELLWLSAWGRPQASCEKRSQARHTGPNLVKQGT